jgi:hypothetical protein
VAHKLSKIPALDQHNKKRDGVAHDAVSLQLASNVPLPATQLLLEAVLNLERGSHPACEQYVSKTYKGFAQCKDLYSLVLLVIRDDVRRIGAAAWI